MTTRVVGPAAGWQWLKRGINLGAQDPKAIFGGAALLMLLAIIPSALQVALQSAGLQGTGLAVLMLLTVLASAVLFPPLVGGYLRIIDAAEHGRPTAAGALFAPFRSGQGMGRMVGFGLAMLAIYLLIAAVVVGLLGQDFVAWYAQVMQAAATAQPGVPPAVPPVPEEIAGRLGPAFAVGLVGGLFLSGIYAIGFGQVALGGQRVGRAVADGIAGTLKNLLPLLVLAVCAFVLVLLLGIALFLLMALLLLLGGLVHPIVAALLVIPVYLAMLVVLYVVMFGVMYHVWRDICGHGPVPARGDTVAA